MSYVGVDGCPAGWVAVRLEEARAPEATVFGDVAELWDTHAAADLVLADVPIGLREETGEPRPCDRAARRALGRPRSSSVFAPPIRAALAADTYQEARAIQEGRTGKSLGAQAWGIAETIRETDRLLRSRPEAAETIRESHPEVCLWALNGGQATAYSKTGRPVAAFWERVGILETVEADALAELRAMGEGLDAEVGLDDLVDAYTLALCASPRTGELVALPGPDEASRDPRGLEMRIWYARPASQHE